MALRIGKNTPVARSLSSRLLLLTLAFVMLGEVLIYAPSVARFRKTYLEERIAAAHLATLTLEALENRDVGQELQQTLLDRAQTYNVVLRTPRRHVFALGTDKLPSIDVTFDLRETSFFGWIVDAFAALAQDDNRVLRIVAPSPQDPETVVEIMIDEAPMRKAMYAFSVRILALSLVISGIAASLVFLTLQWMMVRPMRRITESMIAFRADPEDLSRTLEPDDREDEIGVAQRELSVMQEEVRNALRQRRRLATLGESVAKINHDLRNSLATAMLVSDRLGDSSDPKIVKMAPRLSSAIDRAVELCNQTLDFVRNGGKLVVTRFSLADVVKEVGAGIDHSDLGVYDLRWHNDVSPDFQIDADRDQLFRALLNIGRNAVQAGARDVWVRAESRFGFACIDVVDNGPGIPPQVQDKLFSPFAGSATEGGTGLGLVIAREVMRAHGGDVNLVKTGPDGTTFCLELPLPTTSPSAKDEL